MHRRSKYDQKYKALCTYKRKQRRAKVKKHFMTPKEFLGLYELYVNIKTLDDLAFIINLIRTSKTYKHYKKSPIYSVCTTNTCEDFLIYLNAVKDLNFFNKTMLSALMEWLFSHTVHANSLNSVTFK